jgi:hypothetical protein
MKSYKITANGIDMGAYPGTTEEEAVLAYFQDAGYASLEAVKEVTGRDAFDGIEATQA